MDRKLEVQLCQQAVALGESRDPGTTAELLRLLGLPSPQVRRLAVSALGKLAGVADATAVVGALLPLLRDPHPQVRQYAIKALSAYGAAAAEALADLRDLAEASGEKDYNRRDAAKAVETITEARAIAREQAEHRCQRCQTRVQADEYARAMRAFQRIYCDRCFNEVYLQRRNFDTTVEINKTIPTQAGGWVQSDGERLIANYLHAHQIAYRYDERLQIIDGYAIRPDFYLPEFDLYIEYWGMDTTDYKIGMLKKQKLYQQQGKKLLSLYYQDKARLPQLLAEKLSRYLTLSDDEA
jgi:hypothetical protein